VSWIVGLRILEASMDSKVTPEPARVSVPGARLRSAFLFVLILLSGLLWFVHGRLSFQLCLVVSGVVIAEWLLSLLLKRRFLFASCVLLLLAALILSVWR
jgi:hypothetical protein